jgi:hypothetical protein
VLAAISGVWGLVAGILCLNHDRSAGRIEDRAGVLSQKLGERLPDGWSCLTLDGGAVRTR